MLALMVPGLCGDLCTLLEGAAPAGELTERGGDEAVGVNTAVAEDARGVDLAWGWCVGVAIAAIVSCRRGAGSVDGASRSVDGRSKSDW